MLIILLSLLRLQSVQLEQSDLLSEVDHVRDTSIELMNHSDKYGHLVEPQLALLNQRWADISERIKVSRLL